MARRTTLGLFTTVVLASSVSAQWDDGGWGGNNGDGNPWSNGGDGSSNSSGGISSAYGFASIADFNRANKVLIAHAVIASLVWVIFLPSGAMLLRVSNNPIVLKIHAAFQTVSYLLYIVAAGMGIWLAQQTTQSGTWNDPHPRLGLTILAIAFFQPILGYVHHKIFERRVADFRAGRGPKEAPGRTAFAYVHIWIGRLLLILGIVNGGLGIRLASGLPFQSTNTTQNVTIAYSVVAAVMFILYLIIITLFEIRRARAQREATRDTAEEHVMKDRLPTYDESEESLQRPAPEYR